MTGNWESREWETEQEQERHNPKRIVFWGHYKTQTLTKTAVYRQQTLAK